MAKEITKICEACEKIFKARRDAKTCSPACRKRLQRSLKTRAIKGVKQLEDAATLELQQLGASLLPRQVSLVPLEATADEQNEVYATTTGIRPESPAGMSIGVEDRNSEPQTIETIVSPSEATKVVTSQPEKSNKNPNKKPGWLTRSLAWCILVVLLLLIPGLVINFNWDNGNHKRLNQLNNQQLRQNQQQLKAQASLEAADKGLQVQIDALSARIDSLQGFGSSTGSSNSSTTTVNLNGGILSDQDLLSADVTMAGNTFNGANQLVKLNGSGGLPSVNGVLVTGLNADNIVSGTLSDGRLSSNVALLNGSGPQTFTGNNTFTGDVLIRPAIDSAMAFRIQNAVGTTTLFNADTTGSGALSFGIPASFASTVSVGALGATGGSPICLNGSNQLSTCGPNPGSTTLQQAYQASVSPQIVLNAAQGGLTIQDAATPIGGNLLAVQSNGGGMNYLAVSTAGTGIGATPANGLLTVGTNTTTASGGLYFGNDTNLYRSATNTLQTDSALVVNPTNNPVDALTVSPTINTATINARLLNVQGTFTGSGDGPGGIAAQSTFSPSANVATAYGFINIAKGSPGAGITIATLNAGFNRIDTGSTGGAVTTANTLKISSPNLGSIIPGTLTGVLVQNQGAAGIGTAIGIDVAAQTGATTNIGLRVAAASTYSLQLSGTGGTASTGIEFGTDANLFRSAASTLQTNSEFHVSPTKTDLSGSANAFEVLPQFNPASDNGSALFMLGGVFQPQYISTVTKTVGGSALFGVFTNPQVTSSGGLGSVFGVDAVIATTSGSTATITNGVGLRVRTPNLVAGSAITNATGLSIQNQGTTGVTNAIGIDVAAQTGAATSNIGVRIAKGDTYTLQLSDTGGTAAGGIEFGTDTSLYRSGTSSLTVQSTSSSTTAFQVLQNTTNAQLFGVDTSNSIISIAGNNSGAVGAWTKQTNALGTARQQHSSVVANGYLYVIGGLTGTGGSTMSSVQYAPITSSGATGSWTTSGNPLPAAIDDTAAVTANGYLYVLGGYNGTANQSTVYYAKVNADGSTGAWTTSSNPLPAIRANLTAVVTNGYVYAMGGGTTDQNGTTAQSTVYYAKLNADGSTGAWTTGGNPLPTATISSAAVTANGYIYSLAGVNSGGNVATVYYAKVNSDGSTSAWTTSSNSLPVALRLGSSVVINGYIYYIGGYNGTTGSNLIYYAKLNADGSTGAWTTNAVNRSISYWFDADVTWNGYLYDLAGGFANSDLYYASTERVELGGSLDLVGATGQSSNSNQSGGVLTAGNTNILGTLNVSNQASFLQGVSVGGALNVNGSALFQPSTDSTTAFQIQNAAGAGNVFDVDTTNKRVGIGTLAPGAKLDVQATTNIGLNINQAGAGDIADFQSSGANVVQVTSSGATLFKNATNSTTAFRILDSSNVSVATADTTTDTLTVDNLSVTGTCTGCGSAGTVSLQSAYTTGSTITTSNANNITFNLANTATPANFVVQNAGTNTFAVSGTNGAVTSQSTVNNATAFVIQNAAGSNNTDNLLSLSSVYNASSLITNASFEQNTTGWGPEGNMAISRVTGVGAPFGLAAMQINNSGTPVAFNGAEYPMTFTNGVLYEMSFYAKAVGSNFSTLSFGYSATGSTPTANSSCNTTSAPNTTNWLRLSCTFTPNGTNGSAYLYIGQSDTTSRTWYVDGVSLTQVAGGAGTYYNEGSLNLNGLALGNVLIQPTANTNQTLVVASVNGTNGLTINTDGSALSTSFTATFNSTATVSNSNTSGFVVRNSTSLSPLIKADTSTINNSDTNGSFENSATTATNYAALNSATLTVDTTAGNAYQGSNTGKIVGSTSANNGLKYNLTTGTMASATTYTLSFYAKQVAGQAAFTTLTAGTAQDGAALTACTLNNTTVTTQWQRYTCTFTTGTTSNVPFFYIGQSDTTSHQYYVDGVSFTTTGSATANYHEGNIQLNGVVTSSGIFQNNSDATGVFQIQNAEGNNILNVDSTTSNIVTNSSFENGAGNWVPKGSGSPVTTSTVSTDSTAGNVYQGNQSLKATVSGASSGMQTSTFTTTIGTSTQYQLTFFAKCDNTYNTLTYGRQDVSGTDVNSTTSASCNTNWQQYTAHWTTGGTVTNPDIYINLGSTTAGTVWIDAVSLVQTNTSGATNYNIGSISLGGVVTSPTIFQNTANSTMALQVQNATGSTIFDVDTQNQRVGIGSNAPGNLLSVGALTTASATSQVAVSTGGITNSGIVVQTVAGQSSGNILQAQDSTGAALATLDYQGNLTVKAATVNGALTVNGHVITGNSTGSTTAAVNANAGSGGSPACSVSGNDTGGQVTLTTGTSAWAAGTQCTITFANTFGSAPHPVTTNATNVSTAAVGMYVNATTTTFTINFMNADTAQHTYAWNYFNAQ